MDQAPVGTAGSRQVAWAALASDVAGRVAALEAALADARSRA